MTVYETLQNSAKAHPQRIVLWDDEGSLTYAALLEQVDALIPQLQSSGVVPGSGIALITRNSRYFIIGLYAGAGCSAVVMPIAPQQQPGEIKRSLTEGRLHFILSDDEGSAGYGDERKRIGNPTAPWLLSRTEMSLTERTVPFIDDVAFMRFTSGTTGQAKCVVLSHQSVLERIEAANQSLKISPDDNVVWVLPMAYHFIVSIVLYIRYGAGIILCNTFLAEELLQKINQHRGTFLYASPMHIRLLAMFTGSAALPSLRKVISTTTGVNPEHCKLFAGKYKIPVSQAFGIIEIGLPVINDAQAHLHPGAIGHALPAYEVSILNEEYKHVPDGTTGLLAMKGPGMFDGYLSPPTKRNDVLKNGWFITGDYAVRNADGLFEIKGRKKSMIVISGNKVFPEEVEAVLNSYDAVQLSKVYGRPHPLLGEVVEADIVLKPGYSPDTEALMAYCRKALSGFKVPQRIHVVETIGMTASGKIKRDHS